MIRKFGFKENEKDNSVYAKFENGKFFFHILCIDDILLFTPKFRRRTRELEDF